MKVSAIRRLICLAAICAAAQGVSLAQAGAQPAAQTPAQTPAEVAASGGRVKLGDGRVSFVPPAGFRRLTEEEVALKFARGNRPQYVFADETMKTSVAVSFSDARLSPGDLAEYRLAMESMLPRMIPGLKWLERNFVEIGGRRWLHLEMTSSAVDTDIHNHLYSTSFDGRAIIFGFNSTVGEYPKMKDALEKSALSVELQDR